MDKDNRQKMMREGFSYNYCGNNIWVDIETGDVEIIYPDGSVSALAGTDTKAKEYWDRYCYGDEYHDQPERDDGNA